MSDMKQPESVKRRKSWEVPERELLIEYGCVGFLPDNYEYPESFWMGRRPVTHRGHLKRQSQLDCLLRWTGIPRELWDDPIYREILDFRFHHGDKPVIDKLPVEWKSALDSAAEGLRSSLAETSIQTEHLEEKVRETKPPKLEVDNSCLSLLALHYLQGRLNQSDDELRRLEAPLSDGDFFRVIMKRELYFNSYKRVHYESPIFSRYLLVGDGTLDASTGRIIWALLESRAWLDTMVRPRLPKHLLAILPPWKSIHALSGNVSFYNTSLRYASKFSGETNSRNPKLQRYQRIFLNIQSAFRALREQDLNKDWTLPDHVFLVPTFLEVLAPTLLEGYRDGLVQFRREYLRKLTVAGSSDSPGPLMEAKMRSFQASLEADPLLRCVFHSDLLQGHRPQPAKREHGRPRERTIGVTLALAEHLLQRVRGKMTTISVKSIYGKRSVSKAVDRALTSARGKGFYQHLAVLMTDLMSDYDEGFVERGVEQYCERYRDDPMVKTLDWGGHLSEPDVPSK